MSEPNTRSTRRLSSSNTSSGGNLSSNAAVLLKCAACKNSTKNKATLKCTLCATAYHALCVPDWADVSTTELKTILNRSGLNWYCSCCHPTLNNYVSIPKVQEDIADINTHMKNISELICETAKICKSSHSESLPFSIAEIKVSAARLEEQFTSSQSAQAKEIRSVNVILHKLKKNGNTNNEIMAIAEDISLHPNCITNIKRLGVRNMKLPSTEKLRPTKITFTSPLSAREFMIRFRDYEDKRGTFVTPDLSKEDRHKEYKLRQERNQLSSQFPANKYQIRQGKIFMREASRPTDMWKPVDHPSVGTENVNNPSASKSG